MLGPVRARACQLSIPQSPVASHHINPSALLSTSTRPPAPGLTASSTSPTPSSFLSASPVVGPMTANRTLPSASLALSTGSASSTADGANSTTHGRLAVSSEGWSVNTESSRDENVGSNEARGEVRYVWCACTAIGGVAAARSWERTGEFLSPVR